MRRRIGEAPIQPFERFVAMLQVAGVDTIVDVRSVPGSRRFPWFAKKNLSPRLAAAGIVYEPMGDALGGRPSDDALYRAEVADYEAMAMRPEFRAGLDRLRETAQRSRVCVMCAEREPLDCHRCLLIARRLAECGLAVGHILHDGTIEPQAATEGRLLAGAAKADDLSASGQRVRLATAYRRRARVVAFRRRGGARGGGATEKR